MIVITYIARTRRRQLYPPYQIVSWTIPRPLLNRKFALAADRCIIIILPTNEITKISRTNPRFTLKIEVFIKIRLSSTVLITVDGSECYRALRVYAIPGIYELSRQELFDTRVGGAETTPLALCFRRERTVTRTEMFFGNQKSKNIRLSALVVVWLLRPGRVRHQTPVPLFILRCSLDKQENM